MAKHRRKTRRTRTSKRPVGFVKSRGKYHLVFGKKGHRRLGKGFKTKKALARHFVKKYRR